MQLLYIIKRDILIAVDFRVRRILAVIPGMGRLFFPFGLLRFPDMIHDNRILAGREFYCLSGHI